MIARADVVQARCVCGSQDKVGREVRDAGGTWRASLRHGNGESERITCPSCGWTFIRTTGIKPTVADIMAWGNP